MTVWVKPYPPPPSVGDKRYVKCWCWWPRNGVLYDQHGNPAYTKPDQIIQPWQFGHGETKATCLWLKGLLLLSPTNGLLVAQLVCI